MTRHTLVYEGKTYTTDEILKHLQDKDPLWESLFLKNSITALYPSSLAGAIAGQDTKKFRALIVRRDEYIEELYDFLILENKKLAILESIFDFQKFASAELGEFFKRHLSGPNGPRGDA